MCYGVGTRSFGIAYPSFKGLLQYVQAPLGSTTSKRDSSVGVAGRAKYLLTSAAGVCRGGGERWTKKKLRGNRFLYIN